MASRLHELPWEDPGACGTLGAHSDDGTSGTPGGRQWPRRQQKQTPGQRAMDQGLLCCLDSPTNKEEGKREGKRGIIQMKRAPERKPYLCMRHN